MGVLDRVRNWWGGSVQEAPKAGGGGAKRDPNAIQVKRVGLALGEVGRDFVAPEFDLTTITNAYNTESYVRQAIDKYIELMFKAGWDFVGKNPNTVEYIQQRFKMMAEVTSIPTQQLFIEMAEDLVKYSNVTVAKSRVQDANALPPGVTVQGVGGLQPVGGYFPINVTTLSIKRDKFGTIKGWQQEVEGQDKPVKFKPEDMVHIYYKREKGNAFGTPFLMPVLDDIRALRQAEENVLKLVYRNLFPYIHVQVGLAQEGQGASDPEISRVQRDIEQMDLEAGLVTSERVNIHTVANNQIIDANPYLKYFEQRVFTGLGVSELMMGRGNTANRSTGDNLSGEFADRVKAFQRVLSIFIDEQMIKELLMEGGFDPILNPDDDVDFVFREIDVDAKIKAENHAIFQYEHNAISEDEMRALLGRDPITDRATMHLNLITIATMEAQAALAPAPAGNATNSNNSSSKSVDKKKTSTDNKNRPTNQHGTKPSPKQKASYDDMMETFMIELNTTVNDSIKEYYNGNVPIEFLRESISNKQAILVDELTHLINEDELGIIQGKLDALCAEVYESLAPTVLTMNGTDASLRSVETANAVFLALEHRFYRVGEMIRGGE